MSVATQPVWNPVEMPPSPVRRFTVDEYHRMVETGVFAGDENFELLEGWIFPKMPRTPSHDAIIELTQDAVRALLPAGWRVRVQMGATTADSEPEPETLSHLQCRGHVFIT